jgi:hypothetical protein
MCDSFFVESILRKIVFAFQKLELRARRECQNGTEGLTSRTITRYAFIDIHFDFIGGSDLPSSQQRYCAV